jgi:predicted nucleic acid-binding Zn ribbon protein
LRYAGGMDEHEVISQAMRLLAEKRLRDVQCEVCGKTFRGRGGRYCSKQCRNRAYVPVRRERRHQARATGEQSDAEHA